MTTTMAMTMKRRRVGIEVRLDGSFPAQAAGDEAAASLNLENHHQVPSWIRERVVRE
jgi:hypothetical protein